MICEVVRVPPARAPFELATAIDSVPVANEPKAVTPAVVRRGDDRADGLGPKFGARIGGLAAIGGRDVVDRARPRQAAPIVELLDDPGDGRRVLGQPPEALRIGPAGRGHAHPLADDDAQVDGDVALGDVLVDLAVGEAGQGGVLGHDQRLGLGDAVVLDLRRGRPRPAPVRRWLDRRSSPVLPGYHLPTPTWTSRKRAPGTACPTWPVWPGSPLPQFGVPSMT